MKSLRRRLILLLLGAFTVALLAAASVSYLQIHRDIDTRGDAQLKLIALRVASLGAIDVKSLPLVLLGIEREIGNEVSSSQILVQVNDTKQGVKFCTHPNIVLDTDVPSGKRLVEVGGRDWFVHTESIAGRTVQVGELHDLRHAYANELALRRVLPFLSLLPLVAALAWLVIDRGLKPVADLTTAIEARNPRSLQPIATHDLPRELLPVASSVNGLLERLQQSLNAHQQFCADAAHELRTPLTALRLQVQLLEKARDEASRREALSALDAGIRRTTHLVEQLLALARLDPEHPNHVHDIDLDELAKDVVAQQSSIAEARKVDLGVGCSERLRLQGDPDGLRTLLDNLVSNAVRYAPEGGVVDVNVRREADAAVVEVVDNGPGIPESERERVFDRFHRGSNVRASGIGLGLAIVKRVAERHKASIELSPGPQDRGLRVIVRFADGNPDWVI